MKNGATDVLAESLVQLGASRDEVPCSGAANDAVVLRPERREAVEPFPNPQFQLGVGRPYTTSITVVHDGYHAPQFLSELDLFTNPVRGKTRELLCGVLLLGLFGARPFFKCIC